MGDVERLQEVVTEQAVTTAVLVKAVSSIESLLTQQTISIKEIEKAMKNQEVLMEKFSNLDNRISDSVNRIHKRLDDQELEIIEMKKVHNAKCKEIEPMAVKGATVHSGVVFTMKTIGVLLIGAMFTAMVWLAKAGAVDAK